MTGKTLFILGMPGDCWPRNAAWHTWLCVKDFKRQPQLSCSYRVRQWHPSPHHSSWALNSCGLLVDRTVTVLETSSRCHRKVC